MLNTGCPEVLKALSDETRWSIVHILLEEETANVTDLAVRLKVLQPTMSKHLRILRDAGVIVSEKEGTTVWCRVTPEFRQKLRNGKQILDLGCCTFRFDEPLKS
ncbi:MAG: ArsR/SmtB family transcription factor [Prosthecobacter sp.]